MEGLPCGADTKNTKDHEGAQRLTRGTADFTDLLQIRGRLPPADCQIDWKLPCRPKGPNLPWLRTQRKSEARGGPCVRARRTSGPGACGSMAGFARHALGKGEPRPICPIGPIRPTGEPLGTLQTCLRVQGQLEVWKLRGLEAWLSHCVPSPFVAPQGRSVLRGRGRFVPSGLHAPFSVLRGALARPFPLPGCGAGPHQERQSANQPISQSANQPISQSANQPISQSANQLISQSANQPISQSANQPISQSANQPIS